MVKIRQSFIEMFRIPTSFGSMFGKYTLLEYCGVHTQSNNDIGGCINDRQPIKMTRTMTCILRQRRKC